MWVVGETFRGVALIIWAGHGPFGCCFDFFNGSKHACTLKIVEANHTHMAHT